MFYIIFYILISIYLCYKIFIKINGLSENFITRRIMLTSKSLNPVEFVLDNNSNYIDENFSKCIKSFYPIDILKMDNSIEYINSHDNSFGIYYRSVANSIYLTKKLLNITLMHDIYHEYISIISPKDSGIVKFEQISNEKPRIFVIKNQSKILFPLLNMILPNYKIDIINNFDDIKSNIKKYIIFYITPELSIILDEFSKKTKFIILDFPSNNEIDKYIYLSYPEVNLSKMNISEIKTINTNKTVNTYQFTKSLIINKNASIENLPKSIFQRFEYIRLFNSSKYYRIPMQAFTPELMIKLNIIPLHKDMYTYFKKLGVITYNDDSICKNTIGTIKCNSKELQENSFKLLSI